MLQGSDSSGRPRLRAAERQVSAQVRAMRRRRARQRLVLTAALMLLSFLAGRWCAALQKTTAAQESSAVSASALSLAQSSSAADTASDETALDVPLVLQNPLLPNGCETASLTMLLQYAGLDADALTLCRAYLPCTDFTADRNGVLCGADPEESYAGDPESEDGWYCFEQPLAAAANAYLADTGAPFTAQALRGAARAQIEQLLTAGTPVALWVTLDYDVPSYSGCTWLLPDGTEYLPYANLHCVVLCGIADDVCTVQNPLTGTETVRAELLFAAYELMGSRALILTAA